MCLLKYRSIGTGHIFVALDNQTETKPTNMDKSCLIFHAREVTNKGSLALVLCGPEVSESLRGMHTYSGFIDSFQYLSAAPMVCS